MHPDTPAPHAHRSKKAVLVVDDSQFTRDLVARIVEDCGYEALTAKDGMDALALLESHIDQPFDLIITDVHMPKLDGVQLAEAVRTMKRQMPIIFISSSLGGHGDYTRDHLRPLSPYYLEDPMKNVPALKATLTGILGIDHGQEPV